MGEGVREGGMKGRRMGAGREREIEKLMIMIIIIIIIRGSCNYSLIGFESSYCQN